MSRADSNRVSSHFGDDSEARPKPKIQPNPLRKPGSIVGKMKYKGNGKVVPKDCGLTCMVWCMILLPSLFVITYS
jgi:hypothetical protein